MIDEFRQNLCVVLRCGGEVDVAQFPIECHRRVELKSVMPALMIFAKGSNDSGNFVAISTVQFADRKHRTIDDADLVSTEKLSEQMPEMWQYPMTMGNEGGVTSKMRKLGREMHGAAAPEPLQCFLPEDESIPNEQGHESAVLENSRTTAFRRHLFWQVTCYPGMQSSDMVCVQREHSERGRR